jgi:hypothetical protein
MKKVMFASMIALLTLPGAVKGQEEAEWSSTSNSIAINAGTLITATPVGITYERLWNREKLHLGLSTGSMVTFLEGGEGTLGFYLAFVMMTGKKNNHFEARLGGSYHPIYLYPDAGSYNYDLPFIPVITLCYRYQLPEGKTYYRFYIGTGGVGIGIGFVLGQKAKS